MSSKTWQPVAPIASPTRVSVPVAPPSFNTVIVKSAYTVSCRSAGPMNDSMAVSPVVAVVATTSS